MNVMPPSEKVLTIERVFAAPRDVVFAMWSHPEHLIRWQGPRGHALSVCEVDFRVGGRWRFCIDEGPDETWIWGTYRVIEAPRKLVYSYSMHWHRYETLVSVEFDDLGDGTTRMRFRQEEFGSADDCDDHRWGWMTAMDKLAEALLELQTAGVYSDLLWKEPRRDAVAEDFAEAARRAAEVREQDPQAAIPPSLR